MGRLCEIPGDGRDRLAVRHPGRQGELAVTTFTRNIGRGNRGNLEVSGLASPPNPQGPAGTIESAQITIPAFLEQVTVI